jgi:hypothetical protein
MTRKDPCWPGVVGGAWGETGGRTFESTNAHAVGEGSVAEATHQAAALDGEILYVATEAPDMADLTDFAAVYGALTVAYGEAARDRGGWVDLGGAPGTSPIRP